MQAAANAGASRESHEEIEELEVSRWLWLIPALLTRGPGDVQQLDGKARQEAHAQVNRRITAAEAG
eukprot:3029961-Lingulodinium_polyedra.AAC.1